MSKLDGEKFSGTFTLEGDRSISGELTFAREQTSLYLHDAKFFRPDAIQDRCIHGMLHDRRHVSLLDCNAPPVPGTATRRGHSYSFTNIFPHQVIVGDRHLSPNDECISALYIRTDDMGTVFDDFDAFGLVLKPEKFIQQILASQAETGKRKIEFGEYPEIVYFTGKGEIASVNTNIGTISAHHSYSMNLDGDLSNRHVYCMLKFERPIAFEEVLRRFSVFMRFLSLVAGRPQNILRFELEIDAPGERFPPTLEVYWSMPPKREDTVNGRKPHPMDLPLNAVRRSEEFSRVLENWVSRDEEWLNARARFDGVWGLQNTYSVDRLIGAANMFDVLPESAAPGKVKLSDDLKLAKTKAKAIFKALPESLERESLLAALGRLGNSSLKHKIRHRAKRIIASIGSSLPDLELMLDEAVNCRNYFVHGGNSRIDYNNNFFDTVGFLTNTLEFTFAVSDLLECGWSYSEWRNQVASVSHPLRSYIADYPLARDAFLALRASAQ